MEGVQVPKPERSATRANGQSETSSMGLGSIHPGLFYKSRWCGLHLLAECAGERPFGHVEASRQRLAAEIASRVRDDLHHQSRFPSRIRFRLDLAN